MPALELFDATLKVWSKNADKTVATEVERIEVGSGRTRGLYRQFQARDREECWIAIYRTQKEKRQPQWRQHLKATCSCRSDGSCYRGLGRMLDCLKDGTVMDSLTSQGARLMSVALIVVVILTC